MNYPKYKKVALVMFVVLTLLITGGAIFIGIKLSQTPSTAPEDTNAQVPVGCFESAEGYCACETSSSTPSLSNCCSAPQSSGDSCSNKENTNSCKFNTELIKFGTTDIGKMARCNYTANKDTGIEWVDGSDFKCDCAAYIPQEYRDMATGVITNFKAVACIGNERLVSYFATCSVNEYPYSCSICVPLAATDTPTATPTNTPGATIGTPSASPSASPTVSPTFTITVSPSTGRVTATPTNTNTPTVTATRTMTPSATRSVVVTSTTPTTSTIPATALISDEVDVIILGFAFVFFGVALYKSGLYIKIGQVYWEGAGEKLSSGLSTTNEGFLGFLDNIWAGLSHFDKTLTYMFYQLKVRVRMGSILIYNNIILFKEQIVTSVLKLVSKILNVFLFITIKFKKIIRTIKAFFKSISLTGKDSIKTINKKIKKLPKNFEEKVIDDREEISE